MKQTMIKIRDFWQLLLYTNVKAAEHGIKWKQCQCFWCPFLYKSLCGLSLVVDCRCPPHGHKHLRALFLLELNKLTQLPVCTQICFPQRDGFKMTSPLQWFTPTAFLFTVTVLCISGEQWWYNLFVDWYICHGSNPMWRQEITVIKQILLERLQYPMIVKFRVLSDIMFKWRWLWDLILSVNTLSPLRNMCFIMWCSGIMQHTTQPALQGFCPNHFL